MKSKMNVLNRYGLWRWHTSQTYIYVMELTRVALNLRTNLHANHQKHNGIWTVKQMPPPTTTTTTASAAATTLQKIFNKIQSGRSVGRSLTLSLRLALVLLSLTCLSLSFNVGIHASVIHPLVSSLFFSEKKKFNKLSIVPMSRVYFNQYTMCVSAQ